MKMPDESCGAPTPAPVLSAEKNSRLAVAAAIVIFLLGAIIRLAAEAGFNGTGFDEALYRDYILMVDKAGYGGYPEIAEYYLADQRKAESIAKLPPTRFLYIFCGWVAKRVAFGDAPPVNLRAPGGVDADPALVSLHRVSLTFSILSVGLVGLAAWRMIGRAAGLGAMVLMAASPVSIHMGQHALIDGFFAFWAMLCVWLLWENLQHPNHAGWLTGLAVALALMVMCKENSFFVHVALCGVVALNRWMKLGTVTLRLVLVGVLGPLAGVAVLVSFSGGVGPFVEIYRTLVAKAQHLAYAIMTGDGPWYRYLVDLLTVDPIVLVLAVTGLFTLPREGKAYRFLLLFVVLSYIIMCNVRYGMNLRYTTIWALPLCAFAAAQIVALAQRAGRHALVAAAVMFAGVATYDLRQYQTFFVEHPIYELVPDGMLRAVNIIKDPPRQP